MQAVDMTESCDTVQGRMWTCAALSCATESAEATYVEHACCYEDQLEGAYLYDDVGCTSSASASTNVSNIPDVGPIHEQLDQMCSSSQQPPPATPQLLYTLLQQDLELSVALLVAKALLQLALLRAPRHLARGVKEQFLHQVHAALHHEAHGRTVTDPQAGRSSTRLTRAIQGLLPWLSSSVCQICCSNGAILSGSPSDAMLQADVVAAVNAAIASYASYMHRYGLHWA